MLQICTHTDQIVKKKAQRKTNINFIFCYEDPYLTLQHSLLANYITTQTISHLNLCHLPVTMSCDSAPVEPACPLFLLLTEA